MKHPFPSVKRGEMDYSALQQLRRIWLYGFSTTTEHLDALLRGGYIVKSSRRRKPRASRYRITGKGKQALEKAKLFRNFEG